MVRTFEYHAAGGLTPFGSSEALADASKALPPGAYTTLRTYGGNRILRLDRHVQRLAQSAAELGLAPATLEAGEVARGIAMALAETAYSESRMRLTWVPPQLFVSVEPFEAPPERLYREGARCVSVQLRREHPHAKDSRFLSAAAAAYGRLPAGVHEGLMVAEDGAVLEGLSSNFYGVLAGVLRTEQERVLPGVTRSLVLELAAGLLRIATVPIRRDELPALQEAFLTSVSRGIVPIVRIDDVVVGGGRPGPATQELMRRLAERVEQDAVAVTAARA